ncbi:hypothetical protein KHS38_21295 [Mucilaginibacter sp. Bleaf8]|uniref:hypothetical protein n=1 Tax=Mucilaginibacter sp. Bleaf8 TaxID=2834430 RepID=UPI001BCCDCE5|nr:hypothetical protein [Mucilaginibacter sp. Bleaf8]MBS7566955.1 hypothetical protein [Mucilaginibacter sp. Bleaf8]
MKNFISYIALFILASTILSACQKGKDLESPGFGKLNITSSFAADANPLLVQIDGETKDTLTFAKQGISGLPVKGGKRRILLINQANKQIITDTTVTIEIQNTFTLPTFLYTGTAALFDDVTAKPAQDSMLVRFVITDPALPNNMNIELILTDFGGTRLPLSNKKISSIRKDKFSSFIQLPNPASLLPEGTDPTFFYYVIEGFDPANGNAKVMSIDEGSYSYVLDFETFSTYTPNAVISLGIGAPQGDPSHYPSNIFRRIVK